MASKHIFSLARSKNSSKAVSFSPDGKAILIGFVSLDHARLFDKQTGLVIRTFPHGHAVDSVCFSSEGRFILTGSRDQTARLWHNPLHSWDPEIYQLSEEEKRNFNDQLITGESRVKA